jgi:predicted dehydrogenase
MDKIRLALIGAGRMANNVHYPSLAEIPRAEMVGICDLVEERLNQTADRFGISARYRDYSKMIDETKPDAAYILTPPHQLYDMAVHCLSSGLHLFMEKPPGVTTFQTERLAIHAQENNCLTMVGFNRRYIPLMVDMKRRAGERGPIVHGVATFYKNKIGDPPYYGGAVDLLTCDIIHAVDALRWACGEPTKVASSIRALKADYDNSYNALMEFESGATGVLMSDWIAGSRIHTFEIHSEGFSAFVNPNKYAEIYEDGEETGRISTQDAANSDEHRVVYGFFGENKHFIDSIDKGSQPMTNLRDATRTMQLVDRIYASTI